MHTVAISKAKGSYPQFPFSPSSAFPEYPFEDSLPSENNIYTAIRNNFRLLGFDKDRFGRKEWNPLGFMVHPGSTVFIKPNFVDHRHRFADDVWSVITHPSVIRCVVDYVAIALGFSGVITIGDSPHVDSDFDIIAKLCHFEELAEYYSGRSNVRIEFVDCRIWRIEDLRYYGYKQRRKALPGDPKGYVTVDIGDDSLFRGIPQKLFRGTYTDRRETKKYHSGSAHIYSFARSMYDADAFISIPKLKSHAKVGATLNIKGLIGTIGEKNALVHWRIGFPLCGGDEYPPPSKAIDYIKLFLQHLANDILPEKLLLGIRDSLLSRRWGKAFLDFFLIEYQKKRRLRGAVEFNDTTWRTVVDVYHSFVTRAGAPDFLSIIDGVTGGDTDGPHFPNPVHSGVILTGTDFLHTDSVAVRLMDFDYTKIKYLSWLLEENKTADVEKTNVVSDDFETIPFFSNTKRHLGFRPPHDWEDLSLFHTAPGKDYTSPGN